MKINLITKPFNYIVIDDFYTDEELALVMQESMALEPYGLTGSETESGFFEDTNEIKKTGRGIFLHHMFAKNLSVSKIGRLSRKIFAEELAEIFKNFDPSFKHIKCSTKDSILINYYKNGEQYLPHMDASAITAVTFLKVGEFEGGNFRFSEYNETVSFSHNRVVIFHGCIEHQAEAIKAADDSYRITLAHFIGYK